MSLLERSNDLISEPVLILFTSFLYIAINAIGIYLILYRKDEVKRARLLKGIPIAIGASVIIGFSFRITTALSDLMTGLYKTASGSEAVAHELDTLRPMAGDVGFTERLISGIVGYLVESVLYLREIILGNDISISEIIFSAKTNPLIAMRVPLTGGGFINLYELMMAIASIIILLLVIRTGFMALKLSYDETQGSYVRENLERWISVPVLIAIAPIFIVAFTGIVGELLSLFALMDFSGSYADIYGLETSDYGLGVAIAQLYMLYVEFKLYIIMLSRDFILNALYLIAPVAIALTGHPKEFTAFNSLLGTLIKFLFLPFIYGLAYTIVMVVLSTHPKGNNPIMMIIGLGFIFTIADIFILILAVKQSSQASKAGDGGASRMIAGAAMTTMAIARHSGSSSKTRINSTMTGSKSDQVINASLSSLKQSATSNAIRLADKVGLDKGLIKAGGDTFGIAGNLLGRALTSSPLRMTTSLGAGLVATAATGNPLAGAAAYGAAGSMQKSLEPGLKRVSENVLRGVGLTLPALAVKGAQMATGYKGQSREESNEKLNSYVASSDYKNHKRL